MRLLAAVTAFLWVAAPAFGAEYDADPSTLNQTLSSLQAGDTVHLAAGTYAHFTVSGLNGSAAAWTTITGPESGAPALVKADACCNTVEIVDSSYLAIRNLKIDGLNNGGSFGVSAKGALANLVHHVRVERCTFVSHAGSQQQVAISTKTPTWGWEIRENRILNAGTGLYLGNSDGSAPFIRGIVERNLVQDPLGYCMQIKYQNPWPAAAGIPGGDGTTIIRHNVFTKCDCGSPDGDRPNVLVGGFPDSGPGANDRYEIYGNFFFHNPRESLLQVSGRVTIHDNLFVDAFMSAVLLKDHDLLLRQGYVYNNTIYSAASGIAFESAAGQGSAAVGNLVFAATPVKGTIDSSQGNIVGAAADAASYLNAPSLTLASMDFYPQAGKCTGAALDLSTFASDTEFDRDFNGTSKGSRTFRGAYAGEGTNPGWKLAADVMPEITIAPGLDAGAAMAPDAAGIVPADAGAVLSDAGSSGVTKTGCGCDAGGLAPSWSALLALLGLRSRKRSAG